MIRCPHDIVERDVAVSADGYCPLCQFAEIDRLRADLEILQHTNESLGIARLQLRAALERAYDDAKEAAINPFLADELGENDGPWELQKKIGVAIDFRKKLALAKDGK